MQQPSPFDGMLRGTVITGWGAALPERIVSNAEIAGRVQADPEWIRDRTGIVERRVGGTTTGLAVAAGRRALQRARCAPEDVDLLVLATTSPDHTCPATAPAVQHALGLSCGAFDVHAACSGFVYALVVGHAFLGQGHERVLVVGSETLSRITDHDDRDTAILFGDGAGAVLLQGVDGPGELLGWHLGSDGSGHEAIQAAVGGCLRMDGKDVFRRAVRLMLRSARAALDRAGLGVDDVSLLIPHQANLRIIVEACRRLGVPMARTVTNIDRLGNTSAASIPMALAEAADGGRLFPGDLVLLAGFGAGMTSASAVVRWNP